MRVLCRVVLVTLLFVLLAGTPLVYSAHQSTHLRNFRVVEDGVLYRSGQLTPAGFEQVLREYGIRTVVTLRTSRTAAPPPDTWEEGACAARGVRHVRIVPRVWGADEKGEIPAEQGVQTFLSVMDRPDNHPVLVHCFAGIHRTGTMCAIFRMDYQGWSPERAMEEMRVCGYAAEDMHHHVTSYLRGYTPRRPAAAASGPSGH
jgi:tyrosine-protein phosphatase SIW14